MNQAYILLGTNIDREKNYLEALRRLASLGRLLRISSVYETAPIGSHGENFYNGAVLLETGLRALELKRALRELEAKMGRIRTADRNAPRTIDLDLALFNQDRIDDDGLKLPDPLILRRSFMAQVLAELAPDYVHPVAGRTLAGIAESLHAGAGNPNLVPGAQLAALEGKPLAETGKAAAPPMKLQPELTAHAERFLEELSTGGTCARRDEIN